MQPASWTAIWQHQIYDCINSDFLQQRARIYLQPSVLQPFNGTKWLIMCRCTGKNLICFCQMNCHIFKYRCTLLSSSRQLRMAAWLTLFLFTFLRWTLIDQSLQYVLLLLGVYRHVSVTVVITGVQWIYFHIVACRLIGLLIAAVSEWVEFNVPPVTLYWL